jgi:2-hydroxy-6-oxonona-2,4-dienedioate hydrolase
MSSSRLGEPVPAYSELGAGRWLDAGGVRTWWTSKGDGTPIVFVYGGSFGGIAGAGGAFAWAPVVDSLAINHQVVLYDKPGQGFTDPPSSIHDYTMEKVVEHLVCTLQELDLGPVHLVGHSRGGYVATRATLLRQDLIRSLTLVNSGTLSPGVGTNEVVLAGPPFAGARDRARWVFENYMYDPATVTDEFIDQLWAPVESESSKKAAEEIAEHNLLAGLFLPALARDKLETLNWLAEGRLQRPTQVIWGRDDRTARLSRGVELFRQIAAHERRTYFGVVDKCGHFPYREHPQWFADTVGAFIERVDNHAV